MLRTEIKPNSAMIDSTILLLVRITILMAAACASIVVMRRAEPTWTVALCRAAFLGTVILAGVLLLLPGWKMPVAFAAHPPTEKSALASPEAFTAPAILSPSLHVESADFTRVPPPNPSSSRSSSWIIWAGIGWAIVASILICRRLYSLILLSVANRMATIAPHSVQQLWAKVCGESNIRPTSVLTVPGSASPYLGISGKLVIPESLANHSSAPASLIHVLRHEASHLRRHDHHWFPAISILKDLFWFHPLVWWLASRHLQASENASDAEAARRGGTENYRSSIAEIALRLLPSPTASPALLRSGSSLTRRLEAVTRSACQSPARTMFRVATYSVLLLLGAVLGGVTLVPTEAADDEKTSATQIARIEKKLSQITLPKVDFQDTSLRGALEFLQKKSIELDVAEADPKKKGVKFVLSPKASAIAERTEITLKLENVPLGEALRYTMSLTQMKYQIEAQRLLISPLEKNAETTVKAAGNGGRPAERKMDKSADVTSDVFDKAGKKVPGLEFVRRQQQNYVLEFAGRPDEERFQVTRHASAKYRRDTFIVMKGKESSDGMFRLDGYQQLTAMKQGIEIDVSALSITYLPDGITYKLVRREKVTIPTYFAEFKVAGDSNTYVKKGDTFNLPAAPQINYKLIDVTEKKAVVEIAPE